MLICLRVGDDTHESQRPRRYAHMNREYHKWYSPNLNKDMELLLFGTGGRPVLAFPTSMGRFYQNEDFSLIGTLSGHLDHEVVQIMCVDSIDGESWYNRSIPAYDRG